MSIMTEVSHELDELPDRSGIDAPEVLDPAEQAASQPVELSDGVSGTLRTDALVADNEVAFGEQVEEVEPVQVIDEADDSDLLDADETGGQATGEEQARAQVRAAFADEDDAPKVEGGGIDGPDSPKPPTGGNDDGGDGEGGAEPQDDDESDDEGKDLGDQDQVDADPDTEEDIRWAEEHAEELALLEQVLREQQARLVAAAGGITEETNTVTVEVPADQVDDATGEDTEPSDEAVEPENNDADNELDEPEEEVVAERPPWVETRSLKEIEALKDRKQYTNEDLAALWKAGDPEAAAAFLTRNSGFFHMVTIRNLRTDEHQDYDDVRQQYEYLILKALQKYEPDRGAKALSYAGNIAEAQLADGREPSRDSVGAQPAIRQIERKIFALNRMIEQSGGYEPLTDAQIGRFKLSDDQLASVRQVEARVQVSGFSPLTDAEVLSIFHSPDASSSSTRYLSASRLANVRMHTALTNKLLSADHSAPEYSVWLGDNAGIMSDNEITSHARPANEGPQVPVDEQVEEKLTSEAFQVVLPRALEVLQPHEREILYLRTVEGLSLDKVAERFTDEVEPLSRERVRQIHAGIVDPTRTGSARGSLFRYMIASATGNPVPESLEGPKISEVMRARHILSGALPRLGAQTSAILNGYFMLDGRDATRVESASTIAKQLEIPYKDVNRTINTFVASVSGGLDVGNMRQAMVDFAPVRHPLSEDERRKWGLVQ